jgi:hypothetical protein
MVSIFTLEEEPSRKAARIRLYLPRASLLYLYFDPYVYPRTSGFFRMTWRYDPENRVLHRLLHENLKYIDPSFHYPTFTKFSRQISCTRGWLTKVDHE